jgi:hypothetical protein
VDRHDLSIDKDTVDPKFLELVGEVWWCASVLKPEKKMECLEAN